MGKTRKDTTDRPFGSQMLGIIAILLGIVEVYFTWPPFNPWNFALPYDVNSWIDFTSIILFFLTAIAEIGLGIMLSAPPYRNMQKSKYERILLLTFLCVATNFALAFLGVINAILIISKLQG